MKDLDYSDDWYDHLPGEWAGPWPRRARPPGGPRTPPRSAPERSLAFRAKVGRVEIEDLIRFVEEGPGRGAPARDKEKT